MADSKITELTELTEVADADLVVIVDDVAGTPITKKATRSNFLLRDKCKAKAAGAQSIPNGADTIVDLGAEDWDTNTMHDNSTNNSRITIKTTGYYVISAYVTYAANTNGIRSTQIFKNGSVIQLNTQNSASIGDTQISISGLFYLAATDYIQMNVYQNAGEALNLTNSTLSVIQLF